MSRQRRFCPCCGGWRRFRLNPLGGWSVCPVCGWRGGVTPGAPIPEGPGGGDAAPAGPERDDPLAAFTPRERAGLAFVRWEYQRGRR